jgi:hypothetical protein
LIVRMLHTYIRSSPFIFCFCSSESIAHRSNFDWNFTVVQILNLKAYD